MNQAEAMLVALTRAVSATLSDCALSYIEREPIDVERARHQHRAYEDCLRSLGARVVSLPAEDELPDAVFVEDTAVVVDEVAVMCAPLLVSRRQEVQTVAEALTPYRSLRWIEAPATLEGGDVLRIGRKIYIGLSARSNEEGARRLAGYLEPFGYTVIPVQFSGCLHLKTACTHAGRNTLVADRDKIDMQQFGDLDTVDADERGANALLVGDTVILPTSGNETARRLEEKGFPVVQVDVSELQKAEAGVTCCSLLFAVPEIDAS